MIYMIYMCIGKLSVCRHEGTGSITHHALTMARVNRLFGVTMQERGVSQLISVDLATAEQFAETGRDLLTDQNKDEMKSMV